MKKQLIFVLLLGVFGISTLSAREVTLVNKTGKDLKVSVRVWAKGDNGNIVAGKLKPEIMAHESVKIDLSEAKTCKKHGGKTVGETIEKLSDIEVVRVRAHELDKTVEHDKKARAHEQRHEHGKYHEHGRYPEQAFCYTPWKSGSIKYANTIEIVPSPKKDGEHCKIKAIKE